MCLLYLIDGEAIFVVVIVVAELMHVIQATERPVVLFAALQRKLLPSLEWETFGKHVMVVTSTLCTAPDLEGSSGKA